MFLEILFNISELLCHFLVLAEFVVEFHFIAVLLVLEFEDFYLEGLDGLVLHVLDLE